MLWLIKGEVCGLERASARSTRGTLVAPVQIGPLDNIIADGTERNGIPAREWRRHTQDEALMRLRKMAWQT